ncbi:MAG: OmpA family protein [Caulobacter sp.]|nr:OmpA family protein [Caulobacter sp.]
MNNLERTAIVTLAALVLASCGTVSRFQRVFRPAVCEDMTVSIYFQRDSAAITPEARALLEGVGERAKGCLLGDVNVVGLADAVGAADVNLALSMKRAEAVKAAVVRAGFTTVVFQVGALGAAGALTDSGAANPLHRRADVTFHMQPH